MNRAIVEHAQPGRPIGVVVYAPDGSCLRAVVGAATAWQLGRQLTDAAGREFIRLGRRGGLRAAAAMARIGAPSWPCNRCAGDVPVASARLASRTMSAAVYSFVMLGRSDW